METGPSATMPAWIRSTQSITQLVAKDLKTIRLQEFIISASEFVLSDSSSERKVSVAKSESADSGVGADTLEVQDDQDDCSETERRVIRPDDFTVRELLNFDEVICDQGLIDCVDISLAAHVSGRGG